ncbi:hypothetical protein [Marinifilum caeruleilacunae]|uniref:HEAT repeat domain-containing protein n=1 Tax=Marinifilum caeruleilacunae TaxID=2499076 RepID=A0ABX1WQM6_9BACT|nr:hypothetical protein [Marinifilum caeruleilacunae]NOU58394.1 hypothetical protein [Marinifilum caeruleilacunae]
MDLKKLLDPFPMKQEAQLVAQRIAEDPKHVQQLWEWCISNEKHSWRATWLMDKVYDIDPDLVRPYIPKMIAIIPNLNDESKQRQYLKLISAETLPSDISGEFINSCFDFLISTTTPVAVKVHAMQILYHFSLIEPDIQHELALIIEEQMENGTAGFCSRGRKILKKIASKP